MPSDLAAIFADEKPDAAVAKAAAAGTVSDKGGEHPLLFWARGLAALDPLERAIAISTKRDVLQGMYEDPQSIIDAALAEAEPAQEPAPRLPDELTESGSAHLFARQHKGNIWYAGGRWLVYERQTGRFVPDDDAALLLVQQTVAGMRRAAHGKDDKALLRFVTQAASARGLSSILRLAQIEPDLRTTLSTFDAVPHLVNLRNGVLDLEKRELIKHSPRHRMTHLAGVSYDPDADCPRWITHLDRILSGDVQLILFLQRWAGRALSGISPSDNKRILMPYGTGANGKTVTVETLVAILGDYAATTDFATWCVGSDSGGAAQRQDLVELAGKRLVTATESGYHHKLDEALLKQYTGGEHVSPRGMYARSSTVFRPCFSLLLSTNHLPRLEGADQGFWRRFLKMGFEVSIPEPDQDSDLMNKLMSELSGIFNWMLDGYARWCEGGLEPPTSVLVETALYRNEIDVIGQFIEQEMEPDAQAEVSLADVFSRYSVWCASSGIKRPLTIQQLSSRLAEHGVKRGHNSTSRRAVLRGLALRRRDETWSRYVARPSENGDRPSEEFPF